MQSPTRCTRRESFVKVKLCCGGGHGVRLRITLFPLTCFLYALADTTSGPLPIAFETPILKNGIYVVHVAADCTPLSATARTCCLSPRAPEQGLIAAPLSWQQNSPGRGGPIEGPAPRPLASG